MFNRRGANGSYFRFHQVTVLTSGKELKDKGALGVE